MSSTDRPKVTLLRWEMQSSDGEMVLGAGGPTLGSSVSLWG